MRENYSEILSERKFKEKVNEEIKALGGKESFFSKIQATTDPYEILRINRKLFSELNSEKDKDEFIRKMYHQLSLVIHPDRNPGRDTTEISKKLNIAYEYLEDEKKRSAYDSDSEVFPKWRQRSTTSSYWKQPETTDYIFLRLEIAASRSLDSECKERVNAIWKEAYEKWLIKEEEIYNKKPHSSREAHKIYADRNYQQERNNAFIKILVGVVLFWLVIPAVILIPQAINDLKDAKKAKNMEYSRAEQGRDQPININWQSEKPTLTEFKNKKEKEATEARKECQNITALYLKARRDNLKLRVNFQKRGGNVEDFKKKLKTTLLSSENPRPSCASKRSYSYGR